MSTIVDGHDRRVALKRTISAAHPRLGGRRRRDTDALDELAEVRRGHAGVAALLINLVARRLNQQRAIALGGGAHRGLASGCAEQIETIPLPVSRWRRGRSERLRAWIIGRSLQEIATLSILTIDNDHYKGITD